MQVRSLSVFKKKIKQNNWKWAFIFINIHKTRRSDWSIDWLIYLENIGDKCRISKWNSNKPNWISVKFINLTLRDNWAVQDGPTLVQVQSNSAAIPGIISICSHINIWILMQHTTIHLTRQSGGYQPESEINVRYISPLDFWSLYMIWPLYRKLIEKLTRHTVRISETGRVILLCTSTALSGESHRDPSKPNLSPNQI